MPVDTSMYAHPQEQSNPLAMLSSIVGLQGQMQTNKLIGTEMGARQAVGEAAQGAIGADGQFDPNAFSNTVAHDPRAAFEATNAIAVAQQQREQQLLFAHQQIGYLNTAISSVLQGSVGADGKPDPNKLNPKTITSTVGTLVSQGVLTPKMAAAELASMPIDPQQRMQWVIQHLQKGMDAQQQIASSLGNPQIVNTGGANQIVRTPSLGPDPAPIPNTMSPGDANTPVTGPLNPDGSPTVETKAQFAGGGPITVGLSPRATAAQTTEGGGVANDALSFEHGARGVADMRAALANMSGDIKSLATGPGSQARNGFLAAINSFMGTGFDANKVATQEGYDKLAAQVMARQREQLGLNATNAQVDIMSHASPGSQLSQLGNKNMIALIKGNNDALDAENRAWENYKNAGHGSQDFHKFTTLFNKHVDPLVFQMQYMGADQKSKLVDAMSDTEKTRLAESLAFARHNGLIK